MIKKLFFLFILPLIIFFNYGNANIIVKEWHQTVSFDDLGQKVNIKLLLKVQGLNKGYFYNNWIYKFPENFDVNFIDGRVLNSEEHDVKFNKNEIVFNFKKTFNNEEIFLDFSYHLNNNDDLKYIRKEYIAIPPFAVGAKASLSVDTNELNDMIIFSNNDNFSYENGKYIWLGTISKDGFVDTFELTKKKARWLITTLINMHSNENIDNLNVTLPLYYVGGGNNVLDLKISDNQTPNIDYDNIKYDNNYIYVNFKNYENTEAFIKIDGIVENSYNNRMYWLKELDQNKMLDIDNETSLLLNNVINIIRNNNIDNDPIHIAIAKWVYKNIHYNIELVDDKLTTKEILLRKEGVCKHMAILYRDMLRTINIPATAVDGLAYNTKDNKFEGHSWVLVYYNGEWLPIDPTWNLYSGKLPISHIFLYKDIDTEISFSKYGNFNNFDIDTKRNAKFIE